MKDQPQYPYPDRTRFEWVKMFYPDLPKGIIVGIVHGAVPLAGGPPTWVFDHRTVDTQATAKSPMGIDAGTLRYLRMLQPTITELHFLPYGSPTMYSTPMTSFENLTYRTSMMTDGSLRTRVFLPMDRWTPMQTYPEIRPEFWNVTWLNEDGSVRGRYIPR